MTLGMTLGKSTAVGAFVLGAMGLGVAAILLFGGLRLFTDTLRVVVFFQDSVAGLTVGAPVTLRGVKVGTVRDMKVYVRLPELTPVIPVYLEIEPGQVSWNKGSLGTGSADFELAVKAGLRAQLATQSLVTGQLAVNLDFHPDTPVRLTGLAREVPEIPSIPSDLEHIKNQIADLNLPDLAEKARLALTGIQTIVGELSGTIAPLAGSAQQTTDAARVALEASTAAIRQVQADASRTLGSIDRLANATQAQIAVTGRDMTKVLTSATRATERAEILIGALNAMTGPRAPIREDLEAAIRDLAASAGALRSFTRELERNPAAALMGRSSQ